MRSLTRNQQTIKYALYTGKTPVTDTNGLKTGEYALTYGTVKEKDMSVSPSRGIADFDMFGTNLDYSRTMMTCDMSCPINEQTIVWIDRPSDSPHDYVVVGCAKSINSITYALREVDVRV